MRARPRGRFGAETEAGGPELKSKPRVSKVQARKNRAAKASVALSSSLCFVPAGTDLALPTQPTARYAGRTASGNQKPHKRNPITAAQVAALASCGFKRNEIAVALDIRPGHITTHYLEEFEGAPVRANYQVARNALAAAQGVPTADGKGVLFDKDMAKFWLTNRAGFKAAQALELTGKDGSPIETQSTVKTYVPQHPRRVAPRKDG